MFCYKCGKLHNDDVNFCGFCGASLRDYKKEAPINLENYNSYDDFEQKGYNREINIIKDKKELSVLGIFSLIFGISAFLLFIYFAGFNIPDDIYNDLVFILPTFSLISLILSIIDIYNDNNFDIVIFSFYINFSTFIFIVMYLCYVYLIRFLI